MVRLFDFCLYWLCPHQASSNRHPWGWAWSEERAREQTSTENRRHWVMKLPNLPFVKQLSSSFQLFKLRWQKSTCQRGRYQNQAHGCLISKTNLRNKENIQHWSRNLIAPDSSTSTDLKVSCISNAFGCKQWCGPTVWEDEFTKLIYCLYMWWWWWGGGGGSRWIVSREHLTVGRRLTLRIGLPIYCDSRQHRGSFSCFHPRRQGHSRSPGRLQPVI